MVPEERMRRGWGFRPWPERAVVRRAAVLLAGAVAACGGSPPEEVVHCQNVLAVLLDSPPVLDGATRDLQRAETEIVVRLDYDMVSHNEVPSTGKIRCDYEDGDRGAGAPLRASKVLLDGRSLDANRLLQVNLTVEAEQFQKALKGKIDLKKKIGL